MERYRRASVTTLLLFSLVCLLVLVSEIPLVDARLRPLFILTKSVFSVASLPLAWWLRRDPGSQPANACVGVLFLGYAIHGQCFRPLYYLAFLQVVTMYAMLFPVSRRVFRSVLTAGTAAFIAVFSLRWEAFVEQSREPVFSDLVFSILVVALLGFLSNTYFSSERAFRQEAVHRFSRIGMQAARVVHDLKGLISAPRIYVQMLESKLGGRDPETVEALRNLSRDLDGFRQVLSEFNQLCAAGEGLEGGRFRAPFSEVLASVRLLLRNQLSGVRVEVSLAEDFEVDRSPMTSVLLNLFTNSLDAFREGRARAPRSGGFPTVWIEGESRSVVRFLDNGGGFDEKLLPAFRQGRFHSTRVEGSGLGLMFVSDGMRQMGGRARISNRGPGACVELVFGKV